MKRYFKCLLILLTLFLFVLSLAGCGGKKSTIDFGDGNKVEVSGDEIKLKDTEGNETTIGNKWPDSEWGKKIPEYTKGKIASSVDMAEGLVLTIGEVKKDDFEVYLAEIKEHFYDGDDMKMGEMLAYSGSSEDETDVFIQYYMVDEVMTITVGKL